MILDRLLELRTRIPDDALIPAAHKPQTVRWILNVRADGRFLGFSETGAKKKEYKRFIIPYDENRTVAVVSLLPVDKTGYVLGLPKNESARAVKRAKDEHEEYVNLIQACAEATGELGLNAYVTFLNNEIEKARSDEAVQTMKPGDFIAPRVGDTLLHRTPAVRQYWQKYQAQKAADKSAFAAECLSCGERKPVARLHPIKLSLGGETPSLVTANDPAYWSHGLEQSEIAPMCLDCARAYGEALRYLLSSDEHHLRLGDVAWLFWTREPVEENFVSFFSNPDANDVARLLRAPEKGHQPDLDANDFYALVVSPYKSRLVVRSWLTRPLPEVQDNLAPYFKHQRICTYTGDSPPLTLGSLAGALVPRKNNKPDYDKLPPHVMPALLEHALTGRLLPIGLLHQAVQRARAEKDYPVTRSRAALIKLVLLSNHPDAMIDESLIPDHPSAAYQCGRMFAVLESIQKAAVSPKATLVDRFYGSASATPAAVFGTLIRKAQAHLGKLRKTKLNLYVHFDRTLAEIAAQLSTFPRTLTLEEQGLFALGFYQQKHRPHSSADDEASANEAELAA